MKSVTLQTVPLVESVCLKATQHAILKQRGLFLISTQRDLFWLGEIGWHGNQYCVVHLMLPYLFATLSAGRGGRFVCLLVCVSAGVRALMLSHSVWNRNISWRTVKLLLWNRRRKERTVWNDSDWNDFFVSLLCVGPPIFWISVWILNCKVNQIELQIVAVNHHIHGYNDKLDDSSGHYLLW